MVMALVTKCILHALQKETSVKLCISCSFHNKILLRALISATRWSALKECTLGGGLKRRVRRFQLLGKIFDLKQIWKSSVTNALKHKASLNQNAQVIAFITITMDLQ